MRIFSNAVFLSKLTYNNVREYFNKQQISNVHPLSLNSINWFGHATAVINISNKIVVTDPVVVNMLGHFKRIVNKPYDITQIKIDYILLSHGHMDHIHFPSLKRLNKDATVIVPKGYKKKIERLGFKKVILLLPGETFKEEGLSIKCYEANHDGRRYYLGDDDISNAYLISCENKKVFFAGDTAYTENFKDIQCNVALMPVGCYIPERFAEMHCTPAQSYEMYNQMDSPAMIPIHYKTFKISLEDFDTTENTLKNFNDNRIKLLDIGQTYSF